jgi:protein-tyrosine phosphatase
MIKVLFVCAGNICRSPMAEAVFQDMVNKARLSSKIAVDSAATGSWHIGEKAHPRTLAVLQRHNIPYNGRARQFTRADLDEFDYVLAMDRENLSHIQRQGYQNKAKVSLFLHYAKEKGMVDVDEVPDPYANTDAMFHEVYKLVTMGCVALLAHIRARHEL